MTHTEEMPQVSGLSGLIMSMARRIEGEVDGLSREMLEQWADKLWRLEVVAHKAAVVFRSSGHSKVPARMIVDEGAMRELAVALKNAGYNLQWSKR